MPGNLLTLTAGLQHNLKDKSNTWMSIYIVKIQEHCYRWLCCLKRRRKRGSLVWHSWHWYFDELPEKAQYLLGFDKWQIGPWRLWLFMLYSWVFLSTLVPYFHALCIKFQSVHSLQVSGSWEQCQLLRQVSCAFEQDLQISKLDVQ